MIAPVVTKRYAEALFAAARDANRIADVEADLLLVEEAVRQREHAAALFNRALDASEKRRRFLDPIAPKLRTDLVRNTVSLLLDRRREEALRGLPAAFHRLALDARGEAEGVLESARPIAEAEHRAIEEAIGRSLGRTLKLRARVDPALLGGIRATVGSRRYDATVRGRLAALRERLIGARLPGAGS